MSNKMFTRGELRILEKGKMNRIRVRETHRWTEEETNLLLDNIIAGMKRSGNSFERPTARQFYADHCQSKEPHDWLVKKHKMRHLKSAYVKAKEWKENVASELFESDKKHVCDRIKKMCPYYNKLDVIFGPILNSDPIGPLLMDEETTVMDISPQISVINEFYEDETESSPHVLKQEYVYGDDEQEEPELNEIEDHHAPIKDASENILKLTNQTNGDIISYRNKAKQKKLHEERKNERQRERERERERDRERDRQREPIDIEQLKFKFEKEKFEMNYRLESRKLTLEKEKLSFERMKFFESQKLRKYEIDKQFELKKMEIQRDERMQRFDFEQRSFDQNEN